MTDIREAGLILVAACALAATCASAGTDASGASDAASAVRRGNVLTLRKAPPQAPTHTPAVEGFVRLAATGNLDALFLAFDDVPVQANGEPAIRHFLTSEVIPFFADTDRLDGQTRVTEATFEDGSTGHMAYSYVVTTSGQVKPFVVAWRSDGGKLRVMDVQMGRCVKARHPVTPGRCDR